MKQRTFNIAWPLVALVAVLLTGGAVWGIGAYLFEDPATQKSYPNKTNAGFLATTSGMVEIQTMAQPKQGQMLAAGCGTDTGLGTATATCGRFVDPPTGLPSGAAPGDVPQVTTTGASTGWGVTNITGTLDYVPKRVPGGWADSAMSESSGYMSLSENFAIRNADLATVLIENASDSGLYPRIFMVRQRGTIATPLAIGAGDYLGLINFTARTSGGYGYSGAYLYAIADAVSAGGNITGRACLKLANGTSADANITSWCSYPTYFDIAGGLKIEALDGGGVGKFLYQSGTDGTISAKTISGSDVGLSGTTNYLTKKTAGGWGDSKVYESGSALTVSGENLTVQSDSGTVVTAKSASDEYPPGFVVYRQRGTTASPSNIESIDMLGSFSFQGRAHGMAIEGASLSTVASSVSGASVVGLMCANVSSGSDIYADTTAWCASPTKVDIKVGLTLSGLTDKATGKFLYDTNGTGAIGEKNITAEDVEMFDPMGTFFLSSINGEGSYAPFFVRWSELREGASEHEYTATCSSGNDGLIATVESLSTQINTRLMVPSGMWKASLLARVNANAAAIRVEVWSHDLGSSDFLLFSITTDAFSNTSADTVEGKLYRSAEDTTPSGQPVKVFFKIYATCSTETTVGLVLGDSGRTSRVYSPYVADKISSSDITDNVYGTPLSERIATIDARYVSSRRIFLPSTTYFSTGSGASLSTLGTVPNRVTTYLFHDGQTDDIYSGTFVVPSDLSGDSISIAPLWAPAVTYTSNTPHVRWSLVYKSLNHGSDVTATGATATWSSYNCYTSPPDCTANYVQTISGTTITGLSAGDLLTFDFRRLGSVTEDSFVGDVHVLGFVVDYSSIN